MKSTRQVTEADLRAPEFREGTPDDYEFRDDGKIVRRDRWEVGIRKIAGALGIRDDFEVDDVAARVVAMRDRIVQLLDILASSPQDAVKDAALRVCKLIDAEPSAFTPEVRGMWLMTAHGPNSTTFETVKERTK